MTKSIRKPSKQNRRPEPDLTLQWHKLDKPRSIKAKTGSAFLTHVLRVKNVNPEARQAWGIVGNLYRIDRATGSVYAWIVKPDAVAIEAVAVVRRVPNEEAHGEHDCEVMAMITAMCECLI